MKIARMLEVDDVLDKLTQRTLHRDEARRGIGRALAQNPEAILFDEPTTMVDPIMVGHMGELILRLKKAFHKTSIVVTHDNASGKKARRRRRFSPGWPGNFLRTLGRF